MGDIKLKPYGSDSVSTAEATRKRRAELWDNLNRYVRECGGSVTSIPGTSPLRIEISKTSNLPTQLLDAGYTVHQAGRVTRIGGGPQTFMEADVIEVDLPKVH
jgi:hypothetical protein